MMHSSTPDSPLADRMRPRTLDEFVGQDHLIGPGRLLRRAIQADQLASLILAGPPGTGKTTLARIIANTTRAHFIALNAVLSGVKEIRAAIDTAQARRPQRTLLFIDEVHRFNKSQQDALLPWVENGTVILIGATTENPYFEVNKALVSRSRIFQLRSLTAEDLRRVVEQAIADPERGYGQRQVHLEPAALNHLINIANGDARTLLNALELAVETTPADQTGQLNITLAVAEESIQSRAVLYDKEGDAHFDTISAFIKSLRGSDPDAAMYWLARMVYAGEDPRFIFRRMLILAGEDVGLADPQAIVVVNACAAAFDRVGLPEGRYPLAQAALYLATAPKSNSVMGFFDALATVEREREGAVPNHLKDANRDQQGFGHGAGYLYPHAYRDHWVAQQYLPSSLQGQVFYQPSDQGYEATIQTRVAQQREAQLAALVEAEADSSEVLTSGPVDRRSDRWLQRTLSQAGQRLGQMRDRLFDLADLQRHHLVLDLNAGSGLLTWEAVRRVPEGGVYACVSQEQEAIALREQAAALPELRRPFVIQASLVELSAQMARQFPGVQCDRLIGRNLFSQGLEVAHLLRPLVSGGRLILAESIPRASQRLYTWLQPEWLKPELLERVQAAEEAFYQTALDQQDFVTALTQAGFEVKWECDRTHSSLQITPALIERWFSSHPDKTSYRDQLAQHLKTSEVTQIHTLFSQQLCQQTVAWETATVFLIATVAAH